MSEARDSRQFPRREFVEEVFCYVDGERLDARSSNLSVGGIFVETERGAQIPVGAVVAVVLKNRVAELGSIFLFGKVVRRAPDSPTGLGVRWEKAVGPVEKEHLFYRPFTELFPWPLGAALLLAAGLLVQALVKR